MRLTRAAFENARLDLMINDQEFAARRQA